MSIEVTIALNKNGITGKGFDHGIETNCGISVIDDVEITGENFNEVNISLINNTPGNGPHVVVNLDPIGSSCDGTGTPECPDNNDVGIAVRCIGTTRGDDSDDGGTDSDAACRECCGAIPISQPCRKFKCQKACDNCEEAELEDCEDDRESCVEKVCSGSRDQEDDGGCDGCSECYKICECDPTCQDYCLDCYEKCALAHPDKETQSYKDCVEKCDPDPKDRCFHYFICSFQFSIQEGDGPLKKSSDGTICGCTTDFCGEQRCCPCDEGWGIEHTPQWTREGSLSKEQFDEECKRKSEGCECFPEDVQLPTDVLSAGQSITPQDIQQFLGKCSCPVVTGTNTVRPNPFWKLSGPGFINRTTGEYTAPDPLPSGCGQTAEIQLCCKFTDGRILCSDPKKINLSDGNIAGTAAFFSQCLGTNVQIGGPGCSGNKGWGLNCDGSIFETGFSMGGGLFTDCVGDTSSGCDNTISNYPIEHSGVCCECCNRGAPGGQCCRWIDERTRAMKEASCCPPELAI